MALSARARKRLEVAMARRAEATEISDTIDLLSSSTAGGTLAEGSVLVGNGDDEAEAQELSGDVTMDADGVVTIEDAAVTAAKLAFFKSTEQTGNGDSQNIAHGLVTTPGLVIIQVTDALAAESTFVEGVHDATNVKVTATTGAKYKVIAVK